MSHSEVDQFSHGEPYSYNSDAIFCLNHIAATIYKSLHSQLSNLSQLYMADYAANLSLYTAKRSMSDQACMIQGAQNMRNLVGGRNCTRSLVG